MPDQRQSSFVPHATFDPSEDSASKDTTQRPKSRSRGMTDGGFTYKAGFFVQDQNKLRNSSQISTTSNILPMTTTKSSISIPTPRVIVRQVSSSRLQAPPTSPPTKSLPPSPIDQPDPRQRKGLESLPVSSPVPSVQDSTLSPFYNNNRRSQRDLRNPKDSIMEIAEPSSSSPPSLKTASSQRSLRRRLSHSSSRTVAAEQPSDKRKQWNFPNARLPVPNLPLSIRTSGSPNPSSQASSGDPVSPVSVTEPKKLRKRLFSTNSNQSRPSTSTCVPTNPKEDDTLSVASTRSDRDSSYIPWKVTRNYPKPSSFWEEGPDTTPTSPVASSGTYHPQAIMSRDELAELDATVSRMAESHRKASHSSASSVISSSMASPSFPALVPKEAVEESDPVGLSPPPLRRSSVRTSWSTTLSVTSHLDSPRRPVTADPSIRADVEDDVFDKCPSYFPDDQQDSTSGMTSLSPPPRRLRSTNSAGSTSILTTTNFTDAKISERPNTTKGPSLQPTTSSSLRTPSSSVRKQARVSRSKTRGSGVGVTLEKAIHRSAIMRKPSFLEIEVESELEKRDSMFMSMKASTAGGSASTAPNGETGESFLDLARESFDTIRS